MRRGGSPLATAAALAAGVAAVGALFPDSVAAHGIAVRGDLPLPPWLFAWAASLVLVVSFVGLGTLWSQPRLEHHTPSRELPRPLARGLTSPLLEALLGAASVALLGLTIYAGFAGSQVPTENVGPTLVFVLFWVGIPFVSLLLGDVYRVLSPWRAIGRAAGTVLRRLGARPLVASYPSRLGLWPALVGFIAFVTLELVVAEGSQPRTLALATIVYTLWACIGMSLFGVETWSRNCDAFGVYFGLFARLSPWERRGRRVFLRPPLGGLARLAPAPGLVPFVATMIGSVTFDGAAESELWASVGPSIARTIEKLGPAPATATQISSAIGLALCVLLVWALYHLGIAGVRAATGSGRAAELAARFAPSLVPIAFAYVAAHYFSLLAFQGQAVGYLASDPLGRGSDLLGTADWQVDYNAIGTATLWYLQVGFVVAGHVAGLVLAHDRALALFRGAREALRSQYWMLAVMVFFTSLALWLLSQANA